jgi:hypothetical protein
MKKSISKLLAKIIPWIIMLALGILIAQGFDKAEPPTGPRDTSDTTILYKLFREGSIEVKYPGVREVIQPKPKEIVRYLANDIDTAEIIRSYFSKRIVTDTLVNDSMLFFAIRDTIFMNDIISRKMNYRLAERLKTINNTIYMHKPARAKTFVGGGFVVYPGTVDIALGLAFIPKNDQLVITANYGVFGKGVVVNAYYKIKLKKNDYIRYLR